MPSFIGLVGILLNLLFISSVGVILLSFNKFIKSFISFFFCNNFSYLCLLNNPTLLPISPSLKSALSCLNNKRYSALDVKRRYGSLIPLVTKSSIKTPIYASFLFKMSGSLFSILSDAFIPAIKP